MLQAHASAARVAAQHTSVRAAHWVVAERATSPRGTPWCFCSQSAITHPRSWCRGTRLRNRWQLGALYTPRGSPPQPQTQQGEHGQREGMQAEHPQQHNNVTQQLNSMSQEQTTYRQQQQQQQQEWVWPEEQLRPQPTQRRPLPLLQNRAARGSSGRAAGYGAAGTGGTGAAAGLADRAALLSSHLLQKAEQLWEVLLYKYYNTRSAGTDLRLFAFVCSSLVLALAAAQHYALDSQGASFWADLYKVVLWVFGEEFPSEGASSPGERLIAILTAVTGLLGFALIITLVEQVVLEGVDANVRRGRRVFERGHILILSWCHSHRDLEVVRKVLEQACRAYAAEGGTTVVVMSERSKLEMESMALKALPMSRRYRTNIVFRQGNPLVPGDLELVSAHAARTTLIISDQSCGEAEADAQAVRAAILVDEMGDDSASAFDGQAGPGSGGSDGSPTADRGAASAAAFPGSNRAANTSTSNWNGAGSSNDAGASNGASSDSGSDSGSGRGSSRSASTAESSSWVSGGIRSKWIEGGRAGDSVGAVQGRHSGGQAPAGSGSDGGAQQQQQQQRQQQRHIPSVRSLLARRAPPLPAERRIVVEMKTTNALPLLKYACSDRVAALPTSYANAFRVAQLIQKPFVGMLIGSALFNFDSEVNFYFHSFPELEGLRFQDLAYRFPDGIVVGVIVRDIGIILAPPIDCIVQPGDNLIICRPTGISSSDYRPLHRAPPASQLFGATALPLADCGPVASLGDAPFGVGQVACRNDRGVCKGRGCASRMLDQAPKQRQQQHMHRRVEQQQQDHEQQQQQQQQQQPLVPEAEGSALEGGAIIPDAASLVPPEYLEEDDKPKRLLVAGWASQCVMETLLREFDRGYCRLPDGSEAVFVNALSAAATLGQVQSVAPLENLSVRHVSADPLQRAQLAAALEISTFTCAVVVCDQKWLDPDGDDSNGISNLDERSVLRIDSLIMTVQLNISKMLEDEGLPPINIVCQKVGSDGFTRFEDRERLPLGNSVNFNSYTAKMLTQLAYNPRMLNPILDLGSEAQMRIVESSCLVGESEAVSWWAVAARCQAKREVLVGFYQIPRRVDQRMRAVVNPMGMEERCEPRVWNTGDRRLKFVVLRTAHHRKKPRHPIKDHSGSHALDGQEELASTQQARWVALSSASSSSSGGSVASGSTASVMSGSPSGSNGSSESGRLGGALDAYDEEEGPEVGSVDRLWRL